MTKVDAGQELSVESHDDGGQAHQHGTDCRRKDETDRREHAGGLFSMTHTDADIDQTIEPLDNTIVRMRDEGILA